MIDNNDYFIDRWNAELEIGNVLTKYKAKQFIKVISGIKLIREFDIEIYFKMIEKMIVVEGNKIIVFLLDGTEIECGIE